MIADRSILVSDDESLLEDKVRIIVDESYDAGYPMLNIESLEESPERITSNLDPVIGANDIIDQLHQEEMRAKIREELGTVSVRSPRQNRDQVPDTLEL